ncbi:Pre-mRNA-splicing factor 38, partial [Blastocladiella britannica]
QLKIEKIIRSRCYETRFWKEECFGLNAESIIDKAVELDHIGGIYGNTTPTPFLCLLLKLLQVEPTEDIVLEYILDPEFKYLRALGAFYLRLTFPPRDIYRHLEPLLNDSRKLRVKESLTGTYTLSHVDQFVDDLLAQERVCDVILPRLPKRYILEENDELDPRVSAVQD